MILFEKHGSVLLVISVLFSITMLVGCGGNGHQALEGNVTLDGSPLAGATISFRPESANIGGTSGAATDDDGNFSISGEKGLLPGKYIVTIQKWKGTGRTFRDGRTGELHEITAPIPFKEAKNLEATISEEGPNRFEFHLTSTR